ncbi:MAG: DUF4258 domain-containing protein [Anaerolineae bacterium]|nr:DUF4258 domain-containing protein [Anaerolineae bacterium]
MPFAKLVFRTHAVLGMRERRVDEHAIRHVLQSGDVIEAYPDDRPYPSYLVLSWDRSRPLHVVAADNQAEQTTIIITVYEPDPERWEAGFRTRKHQP